MPNVNVFKLKPVALQDDTYRWTIGIHARPVQHALAEDFADGFRRAWPGHEELLSIVWLADDQHTGAFEYKAFSTTPCDLVFMFDDPTAPDEMSSVLRAAVNARQTPIRVTTPQSTMKPVSAAALSWPIGIDEAKENAAAFALAVFGAFLPKGAVCVDWQDLLMQLDTPGHTLKIVHAMGASWEALRQTFSIFFSTALAPTGHEEKLTSAHTTIIADESLRMAQLRELVTWQLAQMGGDPWFSYAAPTFHGDRLHAFGLLFTEPAGEASPGSPHEPYRHR